jgi:hypothetical protein
MSLNQVITLLLNGKVPVPGMVQIFVPQKRKTSSARIWNKRRNSSRCHSARRYVQYPHQSTKVLLNIDFLNVFNILERNHFEES